MMMGRKKTEAMGVLLKSSGLAAKGITVEQYIRGYDQHADTIMAELSETQLVGLPINQFQILIIWPNLSNQYH